MKAAGKVPPLRFDAAPDSDSLQARCDAAGDPRCPPLVLEKFVQKIDWATVLAARNPSLSEAAYNSLARHGASLAPQIAEALAANRGASPSQVRRLLLSYAGRPIAHEVLAAAAARRDLTAALGEAILQSIPERESWGGVWEIGNLINNPACPGRVLAQIAERVGWDEALVWSPRTPPRILRRLAGDRRLYSRLALAGNPSCPADVQLALAKDRSIRVRFALASNRRCPPEALLRLGSDPDPGVAAEARANPRWPARVVDAG